MSRPVDVADRGRRVARPCDGRPDSIPRPPNSRPALNPDLDGLDRRGGRPCRLRLQVRTAARRQSMSSSSATSTTVGRPSARRPSRLPAATGSSSIRSRMVRGATTKRGPRAPDQRHDAVDVMPTSRPSSPTRRRESPILSMTVVDGRTGSAPSSRRSGPAQDDLVDQHTVWIVRVLESERVVDLHRRRRLGRDLRDEPGGRGRSWSAARHRRPARVRAPARGRRPAHGSSSSRARSMPASRRSRSPSSTSPAVSTSVSEKGAVDPVDRVSSDGRFGAYAEPGIPGRVHLSWVGGDLRQPDHGHRRARPAVDHLRHGAAAGLRLDRRRAPAGPRLRRLGRRAGHPGRRGNGEHRRRRRRASSYALDCGPLGPDTCQAKAARDRRRDSTRSAIVSITFTDECGSYHGDLRRRDGVSADHRLHPGASAELTVRRRAPRRRSGRRRASRGRGRPAPSRAAACSCHATRARRR